MRKLFYFILTLAFLPSLVNGQFTTKNKLSIGYDINYFPSTIADEHTEGFSPKNRVKFAHKEHTISLNYKLKTRISATVFGGFMANRATGLEKGSYVQVDSGVGKVQSFSFGAGINIHLKSGFAPTGNYFGIYLRQHNTKITNQSIQNVLRESYYANTDFSGFTNDDLTLNVTYLGAKYSYTHMLFKKMPLYVNAGIGLYIPIFSVAKQPTYVMKKAMPYSWTQQHEDYERMFDAKMEETVSFYKKLNIFRLNLGVAYCF